MQDPKVEIWEGAALAKAPSVGAQPAGFVRAAVLRWRDVAPAHARRVAELWTSGADVAVAGAAGALTVSTALADGASVMTTNVAGPDTMIPPGPDAVVEVVDGDVVAAHTARVAALCAERGTSARAPASWRDAPLVVALGARTAAAVAWMLRASHGFDRLMPVLMGVVAVLLVLLGVVDKFGGGLSSVPPADLLSRLGSLGMLLMLSLSLGSTALASYARRRIRSLSPEKRDEVFPAPHRYWLLSEPDPQIEALSMASDATRATMTELGFSRRGALRSQVDYGLRHSALLRPVFDRLREGRAVTEAWMERSGLALAWVSAVGAEPEIDFMTVLSDGTLVTTSVLGPAAYGELSEHLRAVPSAGVYYEGYKGLPSAAPWDGHQRLVEQVRAKTGAAVVPVRTLDDALFLRRLSLRKARAAGANRAADMVGPRRAWVTVVGSAVLVCAVGSVLSGLRFGVAIGALFAGVLWGGMWVGERAARASGPKRRTLAELRALPVAQFPDGAVGDWLE